MNVDWQAVRARLAATQARLEQPLEQGTQASVELLRQRAAALAATPPRGPDPGELFDILEFGLAQERYAVELVYVDQVHALRAWTPLPGTPPFLPGIVNFRGRVFSLLDLKPFFELADATPGTSRQVVIVRHRGVEAGILADTVAGIRTLADRAVQAPLPTLTGRRRDFLRGIVDGRLIVLDVARLLAEPALVLTQAEAD